MADVAIVEAHDAMAALGERPAEVVFPEDEGSTEAHDEDQRPAVLRPDLFVRDLYPVATRARHDAPPRAEIVTLRAGSQRVRPTNPGPRADDAVVDVRRRSRRRFRSGEQRAKNEADRYADPKSDQNLHVPPNNREEPGFRSAA